MLRWIRHYTQWTMIGRVKSRTGAYGSPFYVVYYMTGSGRRDFDILGDIVKWKMKQSHEYVDAQFWKQGGPFPSNFEEISTDGLAQMLMRLVDKRMEGK